MTQACRRLKFRFGQHGKFLHSSAKICLKLVYNGLFYLFALFTGGDDGCSLQQHILKSR
jgi:hypothetical protein